MNPTFEQAIEVIKALPKTERERLRDWIDENKEQSEMTTEDNKFQLALQWVDENRKKFDGQWVVLDGNELISHGTDAKEVYDNARAKGIQTPFLKRIKAEVLPWGGW
jgi:Family of unknown function (DUF5678)